MSISWFWMWERCTEKCLLTIPVTNYTILPTAVIGRFSLLVINLCNENNSISSCFHLKCSQRNGIDSMCFLFRWQFRRIGSIFEICRKARGCCSFFFSQYFNPYQFWSEHARLPLHNTPHRQSRWGHSQRRINYMCINLLFVHENLCKKDQINTQTQRRETT